MTISAFEPSSPARWIIELLDQYTLLAMRSIARPPMPLSALRTVSTFEPSRFARRISPEMPKKPLCV